MLFFLRQRVLTVRVSGALSEYIVGLTNLITTLDFVQTEPVSDVVKETTYRVYFISENNEKISNENIVIADKKDKDTAKRMFRLRFSFKNKKYNKAQRYYLVAYDDKKVALLSCYILMENIQRNNLKKFCRFLLKCVAELKNSSKNSAVWSFTM